MSKVDMKGWLAGLGKQVRAQASKVVILVVGLVIGASLVGLRSCGAPDGTHAEHAQASDSRSETIWTCSMHPQIRQPEPGQCPICGMDLIPVTSGDDGAASGPNQVVLSERAQALASKMTRGGMVTAAHGAGFYATGSMAMQRQNSGISHSN